MNFRILHWVDYFVSDIMTEIIRFPNSKNLLSPELQASASQRSTSNIFKQLLVFVIIALSTTDSVSMVLLTNFSPCPKRRIWLNFSTGIVIIWIRMLIFVAPCIWAPIKTKSKNVYVHWLYLDWGEALDLLKEFTTNMKINGLAKN